MPIAAFAAEPPSTVTAESARVTASTDSAQHLTIEVRLDGAGPYRFVVDTGAEQSVLADDVAKALGLAHDVPEQIDGLARRILAQTVRVKDLAFGGIRCSDLRLGVLPRRFLDADGYLGLDAINSSRVTFDFKNRLVDIDHAQYPPPVIPAESHVAKVRVYGASGQLRARDGFIDNVLTSMFVDTGGEVSVGNPQLLTALRRHNSHLVNLGTIPLSGITGGEVIGQVVPVKQIELQQLTFTDCTLAIADVPNFTSWGLEREPAALIGMDFLRQFATVTIDYRAQEIRFEAD